jgi:hypothetical protein
MVMEPATFLACSIVPQPTMLPRESERDSAWGDCMVMFLLVGRELLVRERDCVMFERKFPEDIIFYNQNTNALLVPNIIIELTNIWFYGLFNYEYFVLILFCFQQHYFSHDAILFE